MKQGRINSLALVLAFSLSSWMLTSCSSYQSEDFEKAQKLIEKKEFEQAFVYLEHAVRRSPQSALGIKASREAARLALYETKNYKKAIEYNRQLVLYSRNPEERISAQKEIAMIYFDHLQDYQESISEFSKLLQMPHTDFENATYKLSIARAHYYLNNFFQAESEINELLRLKIDENLKFNTLMLQGNILVAQKNYMRAAEIYRNLLKDFNEKAMKENVPLVLAVCYEESQNFGDAVKTLETLLGHYSPIEYIELRIKRLKERQKNQPGAKGFRK